MPGPEPRDHVPGGRHRLSAAGQAEEEVWPRLPGLLRALAGAGVITLVELFFGLVFNRDYRVWDYRGLPGNFLGQICPRFFLLWVGLAWAAGRVYCSASKALSQERV